MKWNLYSLVFAFLLFAAGFAVSYVPLCVKAKDPNARNPNAYTLSYRFTKGEKLHWDVSQQMRVKTTMEQKSEVVDSISHSRKCWTVLDVDDKGTATIEHQVENANMHRRQTDYPDSSYNSQTDKEAPLEYSNIAKSLNTPLVHLTISNTGEVLKRQPLVPYSLGSLESKILIPLPQKQVQINETWKVPEEVSLTQPNGTVKKVKIQRVYTLQSVKNDVAIVSYKTERLTPLDDPKIEIQLFDKLASGRVEIDLETGHVLKQQTDVKGYVLGFQGELSSMDHTARLVEQMVPENEQKSAGNAPLSVKR